ncbi:hypothetical protein TEA_009347 [Camellia sinensis var. sinensis]|uniref:Uncharacterized protein n=1 Tax=Camellia sinensis var. sinensis TaxID=542762 RepID=A0A4S4ECT2_CAMSN|nr:hypothetical protein TEA_009347 [Camellia sinensis var. sinensis]
MWRRRLTAQLHRFAAAGLSSSPSSSPFRPSVTLLSASDSATKVGSLVMLLFNGECALENFVEVFVTLLAAGSFNHHGIRFSTTVPNDPDTHEDFMPTNKLQDSDLSLKDIVKQDVNDNPVMIYMKGVPDLPRCGFSSLAVRVLKEYSTCSVASFYNNIHTFPDVPLSARNILENPELKNAVKSFRTELVHRLHLFNCPLAIKVADWSVLDCYRGELEGEIGWRGLCFNKRLGVEECGGGSNWPTFPQIFIKGEFVGGSDIILNMHQTGELKEMLKDIAANQEN